MSDERDVFRRLADIFDRVAAEAVRRWPEGQAPSSLMTALAAELRREPDKVLQQRADMADRGWCQGCGHHRDDHVARGAVGDGACSRAGCACYGWSRFQSPEKAEQKGVSEEISSKLVRAVAEEAMHELLYVDATMTDRVEVAKKTAAVIGHQWPPYPDAKDEEEDGDLRQAAAECEELRKRVAELEKDLEAIRATCTPGSDGSHCAGASAAVVKDAMVERQRAIKSEAECSDLRKRVVELEAQVAMWKQTAQARDLDTIRDVKARHEAEQRADKAEAQLREAEAPPGAALDLPPCVRSLRASSPARRQAVKDRLGLDGSAEKGYRSYLPEADCLDWLFTVQLEAYWRGIVAQRDDALRRAENAERRRDELQGELSARVAPDVKTAGQIAKVLIDSAETRTEKSKAECEELHKRVAELERANELMQKIRDEDRTRDWRYCLDCGQRAWGIGSTSGACAASQGVTGHKWGYARDFRNTRQASVFEWVRATFGEMNATPKERARRFFEEAAELAQAAALTAEDLQRVVMHVFGKPPGDPVQELGGVGVALLAYAESIHRSADAAEMYECERVMAIDKDFFRKRHNAKADAGIAKRCDGDKVP